MLPVTGSAVNSHAARAARVMMRHPALSPGLVAGDRQVATSQCAGRRADSRPAWNTAAALAGMMGLTPGRASGLRDAPTLIRAKVNPEPDGMHREQRGDGRPAHGLCSACPCCCRPVSRSHAQERVQPGQRGHNADRQFQAQQRGRKPAEPARDAAGHHRGVADGQPGAHALRRGRSPHPPAADNQLRERIPAGAEPENDGSGRRFIASPLPAQRSPAPCHRSSRNTEPKVPPAATGHHQPQPTHAGTREMRNVIGIAGLPDCAPGSRRAPNAQRGPSAVVGVRQVDSQGELLKAIGLDELLLCRCPGGECE